MSTTPQERVSHERCPPNETTMELLRRIDALLHDAIPDAPLDTLRAEALYDELKRLHAHVRSHQAADWITPDAAAPLSPEFTDERKRLTDEHMTILGSLDRIIRAAETVADRSLEDNEVFVLRVRELVAIIRRHTAEEDRLFYLSTWRDIGGES